MVKLKDILPAMVRPGGLYFSAILMAMAKNIILPSVLALIVLNGCAATNKQPELQVAPITTPIYLTYKPYTSVEKYVISMRFGGTTKKFTAEGKTQVKNKNGDLTFTQTFKTIVPIQGNKTSASDPIGDDNGLNHDYSTPTHESYKGQQDIQNVEVITYGGNLQVILTMNNVSDVWLPPNGFDHVLLHVFIDLPDTEGRDDLSVLNAPAPEGFEWNYVAYLAGWHNILYSSENASTESFGTIVTPTPTLMADKENSTITIQFSTDSFGNPKTLEGAKIYITTWDNNGSDGGHRIITKDGSPFDFGGTNNANPSLIIDDSKVITIPKNY